MEVNYFKNKFDLLNDSEGMGIVDLNAGERNNLLTVRMGDRSIFELVCWEATDKEDKWKNVN